MNDAATMTHAAIGVLLGGALGTGLCLVLWALPRWAAASLDRRVAPYVRDIADPLGATPLTAPAARWRSALAAAVARIGGAEALATRLRRAGRPADAAAFRTHQLGWTLGGVAAGAVVGIAAALWGSGPAALAVAPAVGGVCGASTPELLLRRAIRDRSQRMTEELPALLEFLALCLAAGEGVLDAVRRVSATGDGDLAGLLRGAVVEVGTGASLAEALRAVAAQTQLPAVQRSIDHIVAAMDRGAPLAQVLQAQAADAQDEARRALIEQAGRKEIAMLFPLVFLILPLSVLIAIFPGVIMLRLGW